MANALGHLESADMKTSHGEPATICCSRVLDDPEFTTKLQLYCLSKAAVMLATTWFKLEAMKTVRVVGVEVGVGVGVEVATGEGVVVDVALGVAVGVAVASGVGVGDVLELPENAPLPAKKPSTAAIITIAVTIIARILAFVSVHLDVINQSYRNKQ